MSAQVTTSARPGSHPAGRRRLRAPLGLAAAGAASAAVLLARSPYLPGSYGFCPFRALTGGFCPGCGGLRATHGLLRGDLAAAWDMNPVVVVALPLLAVAWTWWAWRAWRGRPATAVPPAAVVALAVVLVAFTVARNLPVLAPYLAP